LEEDFMIDANRKHPGAPLPNVRIGSATTICTAIGAVVIVIGLALYPHGSASDAAPDLLRQSASVGSALRFNPEDFYSAGKLSPEQLQALREMTPEQRMALRAEGHRKAEFERRRIAAKKRDDSTLARSHN
jgi:hypothetical protein